ncbi:MAG: nucleoside deaminase [Bacteroidales bacterium]|jgi:tRNA(adenine34) deaminase|nr:nucleoside deaminase [Bacteroidales bacterium]MBO7648866.1 nucleoside deaminase [Bacteroidales bacterium]
MENKDEYYMKMALAEAREALDADEVPVGAVIVLNDRIIARGHNLTETLRDVTAHAEMIAITAASSALGAKYLKGCTLYVTLEPCVMCAGAIAHAQLDRLVYGADDPKKGYTLLRAAVLPSKMNVEKGILQSECAQILIDFFKEKR